MGSGVETSSLQVIRGSETPLLREYVSSTLLSGAVEGAESLSFHGPPFIVSRQDSVEISVILDMSTFHELIACPRFIRTTITTVCYVLSNRRFFLTTPGGLQDAYGRILVHHPFRRSMGFRLRMYIAAPAVSPLVSTSSTIPLPTGETSPQGT